MKFIIILLLVYSYLVSTQQTGTLYTIPLKNNALNATCLDGSPPSFTFYPGIKGSTTWIIWFPGGGFCFTPAECAIHELSVFGSSVNWTTTEIINNGLLTDNYDSHAIQMTYCDGSSFIGRNGKVQGRNILITLMDNIRHALPNMFLPTSRIIIAGSSAGAFAVLYNFEFLVNNYFTTNTQVVGLLSAGFFINVPVVDSNPPQYYIEQELRKAVDTWGMDATTLNQRCVDGRGYDNRWQCLFSQYLYPYVKGRFFNVQSQFDLFQLSYIMGLNTFSGIQLNPFLGLNSSQSGALDTMRHTLTNLMQAYLKPGDALFTPAYAFHTAFDEGFWSGDKPENRINAVCLKDAFFTWFNQPNPFATRSVWIETSPSAAISTIVTQQNGSASQLALIVSLSVIIPIAVIFIITFGIHMYLLRTRTKDKKGTAIGFD